MRAKGARSEMRHHGPHQQADAARVSVAQISASRTARLSQLHHARGAHVTSFLSSRISPLGRARFRAPPASFPFRQMADFKSANSFEKRLEEVRARRRSVRRAAAARAPGRRPSPTLSLSSPSLVASRRSSPAACRSSWSAPPRALTCVCAQKAAGLTRALLCARAPPHPRRLAAPPPLFAAAIDKNKFLVPGDLTVSQFVFVVRKRLALAPEQSLFIFCSGTLPTTGTLLRELYSTYADPDGFLYLLYAAENTFGGGM